MATKPLKIGAVTVKPLGKDRWQIRYHDPASGRDVRRRLAGLSEREATGVAGSINHELLGKGGYVPEPEKPKTAPTIVEGLAEAIQLADARQEVRRERVRLAKKFVQWLAERYPGVHTWDQLRPAMVQSYVNELKRSDKAFDTIRLCVAPIKLAWGHMAENHKELVRPLTRKSITMPTPADDDVDCLERDEVVLLLDWLKVHAPDLWPMACLQALAGLRMLECVALRAEDLDLQQGIVTITNTHHHQLKTRKSKRTIPVCREVAEALRMAAAEQKIRPATGELFTNRLGNLWVKSAISHRWTKTLRRAARELDCPQLARLPARKLRAAFVTMADRMGAPNRLLKRYVGHASSDVMGDHYRKIDVADLRAVSSLMNTWKREPSGQVAGKILATR